MEERTDMRLKRHVDTNMKIGLLRIVDITLSSSLSPWELSRWTERRLCTQTFSSPNTILWIPVGNRSTSLCWPCSISLELNFFQRWATEVM